MYFNGRSNPRAENTVECLTGLRFWFKATVSTDPWVRIPPMQKVAIFAMNNRHIYYWTQ